MPQIGKSAKLYQERRQSAFQDTLRGPGPQIYLPDNPVNSLELEPPHHSPIFSQCEKQSIDIGRTQAWPFGDKYAQQ